MKNRNAMYRSTALVVLSGVILLIFVLSSQPYRVQTIQPYLYRNLSLKEIQRFLPDFNIRYDGKEYNRDVNPFGLIEFLFRKGAHMFVYGVLAMATALALRMYRKQGMAAVVISLLVVLLVALADEWNQKLSAARTPAYQDVILDLTGGVLGVAVFYGIDRLYRFLRTSISSKNKQSTARSEA